MHTFWLYCLLYYRRFPLLCIKRDAPCQLQINCHFHFLNFPTVSSLLHIRKILVHWPFLEISGPQKWVVGATLALKQKFLAGTLFKHQWDTKPFHFNSILVYVAIAKVILLHVNITCYFHMWRYQVFARKLTWYFIWHDYIKQMPQDAERKSIFQGKNN